MNVLMKGGDDRRRQMLLLLADGKLHSGAVLATALSVSRTAVSNYARELAQMGVELHAARGSGYRLDTSIELLDPDVIYAAMPSEARTLLSALRVYFATDSTNQRLIEMPVSEAHACACVAETQTAGRGRRGRSWLGAPGQGVFLSLAWKFPGSMQSLAGLSLAVGVCVQRALMRCCAVAGSCAPALQLKWPNDIVCEGRKLGGVLVEVSGEIQGPCLAIIGVGINVSLPDALQERLAAEPHSQPATDLAAIFHAQPSRNAITGAVLAELLLGMRRFEQSGWSAFADAWSGLDALKGRDVSIEGEREKLRGIARGVDEYGALLIETARGLRQVSGGEVSVRATP